METKNAQHLTLLYSDRPEDLVCVKRPRKSASFTSNQRRNKRTICPSLDRGTTNKKAFKTNNKGIV